MYAGYLESLWGGYEILNCTGMAHRFLQFDDLHRVAVLPVGREREFVREAGFDGGVAQSRSRFQGVVVVFRMAEFV